jgi:Cof subfamily protein (haloacid dehalogenase superfamily)
MAEANALPSSIALVISDIDGTLITSNHELTDATRAEAQRLYDKGIHLSLASSRPPRSILPFAESLQLRSPFAAFNGALVTTIQGDVVARSIITSSVIARVKAIADGFGLGVWLYDERDWWVGRRDAFVDREEHTSGFSPEIDGYDERLTGEANKLTVVGKPELVAQAEQVVLSELATEVSASRSKPRFLDVTAFGIHKGAAVIRLAKILNVSTEQVAVIGDGPNDVDMFKQAGVSIAMGQAVDDVRDAARYVTTSNDDEGWARGIDRYVLKGSQSAVR